ncbi:hypothetical protein ATANTOWER_008096, partial [Ataeniobius toweri]|nr:hypothetical protein [Ataeniobius toweri]
MCVTPVSRLGLGLLPLLDQFPPRYTTCRWLVSLPAGVLVVLGVQAWVLWCVLAHSRWLLAGAWTPGLCRASAWGVICPGFSGLWVHGWICSDIDGCRRGLWAHCCSSLGLLHCGCWVVPLGLSPALLWGWVAVVPAVVLLEFLCFGGLWMSVARISSISVPGPGGQNQNMRVNQSHRLAFSSRRPRPDRNGQLSVILRQADARRADISDMQAGEDRSESTGAYSLTAGRRVLCSGRRGVAGWTEVNRWTETRCSRTWRDESCGTERE